jgi:ATP synthase A1 C subunit
MEVDPHAAYINARIRGKRSQLLTRNQFEQLLDQDDLQAVVDFLLASTYETDMAEALTQYEGADAVEEAVSRNVVRTLQHILKMTQEDYRRMAGLFLVRWDLIAVKSLLRLRHHGIDAASGPDAGAGDLFPGPTLTVALQNDLAQRDSMESLVGGLAAWNSELCGVLVDRLGAYQEGNDLSVLEDALDRNYFVNTVRKLEGSEDPNAAIVRKTLRMEIDRMNLRTVFRYIGSDLTPEYLEQRLLPQGLVSLDTLRQMAAARNAEQAMEFLGGTAYSSLVERLYEYVQSGKFSPFERLFEHMLLDELRKESRQQVFSLALFMHYAWLKYNEVLNLRMLARGEARHLPRGRIREEMLYA